MSLNIPNLDKLIAHLEAQPPERFDIQYGRFSWHPCGTAACILGHGSALWGDCSFEEVSSRIGGHDKLSIALYHPPGYSGSNSVQRYPLWRAIATLKRLRDRFLATGEIVVDWGAEPGAGEPWAAPRAAEITPPALPETLTRLLAAQPAPTATEAVRG